MKDQIFGVLQRVGRSFMLPIAILPVAGLFLGIGGSFTNPTTLETYGLTNIMGEGTILHNILLVMNAAGGIVFDNLPLIFAIGCAIGMAKSEKATAALAAAIAFLVMHASIGSMITVAGGADAYLDGSVASVLGIESLQMGVFGGMIVGLGVAALHNRYYKIQLPTALSFFEGTRFVPIVSAIVFLVVGILMSYIWPPIQAGIYAVGELVQGSGYAGTLLYGFMERLLIPFGLHHVFYLPFWQTAVGGTLEVSGQLIEGAQNIFFAQLSDPTVTKFSVEATRFMSGKFPLMIFGLPGAALAMYRTAKPENRKVTGGLLLSAALTSMLTGITEPLEFTFLFVAMPLYAIHCVLAGAAYMLMHIFQVGVGMTFSGGFIDMFLYGILQGNAKTNWIWIVIVGIFYFVVYYFLFTFLIKKFNYKTPGRDDSAEEIKLYTRADMNAKNNGTAATTVIENEADALSAAIIYGLGGAANIVDVDSCATRLRTTVANGDLVDQDILNASGAAGVMHKGNGVQVIYGPRVSNIKSNLEEFIQAGKAAQLPSKEEFYGNAANTVAETQTTETETVSDTASLAVIATIQSPMSGTAMNLSEVPDPAFASGALGNGFGVEPNDGKVTSPITGQVMMVFETKHAIGLVAENGVEVMIHVGLDTVNMKGEGFTAHVKAGDQVKVGDLLLEVDLDAVKAAGHPTVTPIVITNTANYQAVELTKTGDIQHGDDILTIK
ncbi:PTS glucose transporter subunit IIA [Aerococcaceae bacterium DSM 109653]|uniref:PTS glucose transporter subunit IIA n=1 Tax=Fundicoccus ignavus TaxID=2664442 RepID=A0A844BVB3_9LACT|nr:PTS transporter subunit IIABC [Fundicoccus ignavus]MRI80416.1 PTS glucose transporter subunit IIA [Fundicoccus ignavus]